MSRLLNGAAAAARFTLMFFNGPLVLVQEE